MKLPTVGAGGVHAQHVLPRSRPLAVDRVGDAADGHRHIAAGDGRHRPGTFSWMQRYRHRQRPAQCQPLPHFEHPPCDMGVLHEDEFVALDGKFRQPVHHRKNAVMVTRRNGFEKPSPYRLRRRQDKGGRAWIGCDLPFDEIENRPVITRLDRKTHGPWSGPGGQHRICGTSRAPGEGVGEAGHCG